MAPLIGVLVPEYAEALLQFEVFPYANPSAGNVLPPYTCCLASSQPFKLSLINSSEGPFMIVFFFFWTIHSLQNFSQLTIILLIFFAHIFIYFYYWNINLLKVDAMLSLPVLFLAINPIRGI